MFCCFYSSCKRTVFCKGVSHLILAHHSPNRKHSRNPAGQEATFPTQTISTGIGSFPLRSAAHGREIATVTLGKGEYARNFTMHKSLLSHFDGALNDGFKERSSGLDLSRDCPFAFRVLYQWVYSGKVMDQATWYTDGKIPADLLWLRVYKLADCKLVEPSVETGYARLHDIFAATNKLIAPPADFLYELYDETGPEHRRRCLPIKDSGMRPPG